MSNEMNRHNDGKLWIHVELIPSWYDRIINDDLDWTIIISGTNTLKFYVLMVGSRVTL